jgi:hypothetical protein
MKVKSQRGRIVSNQDDFLFGAGSSSGTSFIVRCEFCNEVHNPDSDPERMSTEGYSIATDIFMGKEICQCCFRKLESEIYSRRFDILRWFKKVNEIKQKDINKVNEYLNDLDEAQS